MNRRERKGGVYHPFIPDFLGDFDAVLYPETAAAVSSAERAIASLNDSARYLTDTEPLARLILRSEAMASSRIEGLEVDARKLLEREALHEMGVSMRADAVEASVLRNISAMQQGIDEALRYPALALNDILSIHEALMGDECDFAGIMRTQQNWIGGNKVNPIGARYVPPPAEYVAPLLADMVDFCNGEAFSPLVLAAVAHAQFETIHPFADGNGRTGRALVHVLLKKGGLASQVVPPISLVLATDRARYVENLAAYRVEGASLSARVDAMNGWVEYFSHIAEEACARAADFEDTIRGIKDAWTAALKPRARSAAALLIEMLPTRPVISIASAAEAIGRSYPAARLAVAAMVEKGILVQNAKNRKSGIFVARDILDAFTSYERALASVDGDTAASAPVRPVLQRKR